MTAQDILSLAVNVAQNQWPLDERHSTALRVMLDEVLEQVVEVNRLAIENARRAAFDRRKSEAVDYLRILPNL